MTEHRVRLLEKANTLPATPGVYLMRDRNGKVIYVGKSRKLKNRVSQYFQNSDKGWYYINTFVRRQKTCGERGDQLEKYRCTR